MDRDEPIDHLLRTSDELEGLSPQQRQQLTVALEEGFLLRNVQPKCFCLLDERENWDVAIILDACRFDAFARVNFLAGDLEMRISPASCTQDWIGHCLQGDLGDVVYISASPYISHWYFEQIGLPMTMAHLEEVWQAGWDDSLHTVPPSAVAAAYRRLRTSHPAGKFVLHFMQPHHPYIGKRPLAGAGWRKYFGAMELDVPELEGKTPIEMLADGRVPAGAVIEAYESNLELVLREIEGLRDCLPPQTVITADHGEAFGECGIFGHPPGLLLPELIKVPYLRLSALTPQSDFPAARS